MEISPQQVRSMSFSTVKRGYDADEVKSFVEEVAAALEVAQNETTAMEARARAAVARLQELSQTSSSSAAAAGDDADAAGIRATVDENETISRTLLLAQRTADTTVAEAHAEAERLLVSARDDAAQSLDQARGLADQLIEDAKDEARRVGEGERIRVESEVQALNARRDFLESDVDHLESFLVEQRQRIRESAAALTDIVERVPDGLGDVRRPLLSAAGDPAYTDADEDDTQPYDSFPTSDDGVDESDEGLLDERRHDPAEERLAADHERTPAGGAQDEGAVDENRL